MRLPRALPATLALALALTGCGGSSQADSALPNGLANRLARESDAVAGSLEAGDECGAAQQADDLKSAADAAIASGQVPVRYQNELERIVTELQNEVNCPPAPGKPGGEKKPHGPEKKGHGPRKKSPDATSTDTSVATSGAAGGEGD